MLAGAWISRLCPFLIVAVWLSCEWLDEGFAVEYHILADLGGLLRSSLNTVSSKVNLVTIEGRVTTCLMAECRHYHLLLHELIVYALHISFLKG